MPFVYPDQNAVINMGLKARSNPAFDARLRKAMANGAFVTVLSAWHWVEASKAPNLSSATQLADFMDSLKPLWLRDRRGLERAEVISGFYNYCGVAFEAPQQIISRIELIAAINGVLVHPSVDRTSSQFVEGWIKHPESMHRLTQSYQSNADAIRNLRKAITEGKVTPEVRQRGDRQLINGFLPALTPAGVQIGKETKDKFLDESNLKQFPSLSIEAVISEHTWTTTEEPDWNSMIDRIHMIAALPYVDAIVSDDKYFHSIYPVAKKTGFVRARLLKFDAFCAEFIGA